MKLKYSENFCFQLESVDFSDSCSWSCGNHKIIKPFNKKVKAEILGVANDTAFITKTNECLITYYSSKNQFEISIPTASFTSGDATKDSLFQLNNSSLIKITGKVSGNVFDLFSNENSNQDDILEGDLYMNNKELHISEEYHIYTSLSSQVEQKKMYVLSNRVDGRQQQQ